MSGAITIWPGRPLQGRIIVPGDKSISHRVLLLAALAAGESSLRGLSRGEDVAHTLTAMRQVGAAITVDGPEVRVAGGRPHLHAPASPLDVGNSGTGIRLLAGWVASFPWSVVLLGDDYVANRPMGRVAEPLRLMGATVEGRDGGSYPPLTVHGGDLRGIDYRLPVASAQVKSAVLLAGLAANGATTVREPAPTRAHTEELLARAGATIAVTDGGSVVTVHASELRPLDIDVPGDPSQAAFWLVAGCVVPGSDVTVENVYVGRARAEFLAVLRRMGAELDVTMRDATTADIRVRHSALVATDVGGDEVPGLIDEIPVLAVAAARAEGRTEFHDAAELRVKETDRVVTTIRALSALGVSAAARDDGLAVTGGAVAGGVVDSAGDHRIAMAAAIAGLVATGPTTVRGWEAVATSYPTFVDDLRRLGGQVDE